MVVEHVQLELSTFAQDVVGGMVSKDGGGRSKGEEFGADVDIFLAEDLKMLKKQLQV